MRGMVPGMASRSPIIEMLPAVYQEDPFTERFVRGFDDVLAPILATLDCLVDYFDPYLAPEDFLEWLAGWVGIEMEEGWPISRRRAVLATAVEMYRMRGTVAGLRANLQVLTGGRVEIADSGAVGWSKNPNASWTWAGGPVSGVIAPDRQARIRLVAASAPPGLEPSALPSIRSIPNNHRSYAIQWFAFAGIAVVIYFLALRKRFRPE